MDTKSPSTYARSLPLRKVIDPWPVKEYFDSGELVADYRDVLECGHTVQHRMGDRAARRRCYLCGPKA